MIGHCLGRMEASIKKFDPHLIYDSSLFQATHAEKEKNHKLDGGTGKPDVGHQAELPFASPGSQGPPIASQGGLIASQGMPIASQGMPIASQGTHWLAPGAIPRCAIEEASQSQTLTPRPCFVKSGLQAKSRFEMCFDIGSQHLGCWGQNTFRIQNKEIHATLCLQATVTVLRILYDTNAMPLWC